MNQSIDGNYIFDALNHSEKDILSLTVLDNVDSTNSYLVRNAGSHGQVCIADRQTAGRGRYGNKWYSPPGKNIYVSLLWEFSSEKKLRALSLVTALSLAISLRKQGFDAVGIKWPNDIYLFGEKLGGVLIDTICKKNAKTKVIIGIGMNVKKQLFPAKVGQPATFLESITTEEINRNQIIALLIDSLLATLEKNPSDWDRELQSVWDEYDVANNKKVEVTKQGVKSIGVATGINESLQLCLRLNKQLKYFDDMDSSMKLLP